MVSRGERVQADRRPDARDDEVRSNRPGRPGAVSRRAFGRNTRATSSARSSILTACNGTFSSARGLPSARRIRISSHLATPISTPPTSSRTPTAAAGPGHRRLVHSRLSDLPCRQAEIKGSIYRIRRTGSRPLAIREVKELIRAMAQPPLQNCSEMRVRRCGTARSRPGGQRGIAVPALASVRKTAPAYETRAAAVFALFRIGTRRRKRGTRRTRRQRFPRAARRGTLRGHVWRSRGGRTPDGNGPPGPSRRPTAGDRRARPVGDPGRPGITRGRGDPKTDLLSTRSLTH